MHKFIFLATQCNVFFLQVQTLEQEKIDLAQSKNELSDKIIEIENKSKSENVVQPKETNEPSVGCILIY